MSNRVRLKDIVTALRAGQSPVSLGAKYLGEGIERTAYVLGKWVIKNNDKESPWDDLRLRTQRIEALRFVGILPIKTYYTDNWAIQPLLTPLSTTERNHYTNTRDYDDHPADIHGGNLGYDRSGTLRAFDW